MSWPVRFITYSYTCLLHHGLTQSSFLTMLIKLPNFAVESFGFAFIYPFKETERLVYAYFYIIYEHFYPFDSPTHITSSPYSGANNISRL